VGCSPPSLFWQVGAACTAQRACPALEAVYRGGPEGERRGGPEGERRGAGEAFALMVMNGRYIGGGMEVTPHSRVDPGALALLDYRTPTLEG
jgi:hypothetical protein